MTDSFQLNPIARNCNWVEVLQRVILDVFLTCKLPKVSSKKCLEECKKAKSELVAEAQIEFLFKLIDLKDKHAVREKKKLAAYQDTIRVQEEARRKVILERRKQIKREYKVSAEGDKGKQEISEEKLEKISDGTKKNSETSSGHPLQNSGYHRTSLLAEMTREELVERIRKNSGIKSKALLEYAVSLSATELFPTSNLIDYSNKEETMIAAFRLYGPLAAIGMAVFYKLLLFGAINLVAGSSLARLFEPIILILNVIFQSVFLFSFLFLVL